MAMTQTKLHAPVQLNNSVGTHYTVPGSTTTIVKQIALCNTSANNRTVDVHLVPNGGTAGVANAVIYNVVVDATSTTFVNMSAVMDAGDFIAAKAQVASAVTMHSFGIQEA
ncbi:MAG: hypothetical protein CL489_11025 [Acidobacteria bacterium]|nr:hypothetical protein [Acidobacteriota bacterium]